MALVSNVLSLLFFMCTYIGRDGFRCANTGRPGLLEGTGRDVATVFQLPSGPDQL